MRLDEHYTRRVRIEGKPGEMMGYQLVVRDIDTDELIEGVVCALVTLDVNACNRVELTYYEQDAGGQFLERNGKPVERELMLDNPEIAVTALEVRIDG